MWYDWVVPKLTMLSELHGRSQAYTKLGNTQMFTATSVLCFLQRLMMAFPEASRRNTFQNVYLIEMSRTKEKFSVNNVLKFRKEGRIES